MRSIQWNQIGSSVVVACVLSLGLMTPWTVYAGAKVEVCHVPPGNPSNFHTITISENALPAHLGHGDMEGACNGNCATLCDDGNLCTIDDTGDCGDVGCPTTAEPVNCDDSNPATVDSCQPATGCINTPTEPPVSCPCDFSAQNFTNLGGSPVNAICTTNGVAAHLREAVLPGIQFGTWLAGDTNCAVYDGAATVQSVDPVTQAENERCISDILETAAALNIPCN